MAWVFLESPQHSSTQDVCAPLAPHSRYSPARLPVDEMSTLPPSLRVSFFRGSLPRPLCVICGGDILEVKLILHHEGTVIVLAETEACLEGLRVGSYLQAVSLH